MEMNIPTNVLEHLLNINAPMKKMEFQGKYIGFLKDQFPQSKGNVFGTGDLVIIEKSVKWIRIFEKLYKSPFSDRYVAFYMNYEDCIKYNLILTEPPKITQFHIEFQKRLHAATSTEEYVSLLHWIATETFQKGPEYKKYEKYEEVAKHNPTSIEIFMEQVDPIESCCLKSMMDRLMSCTF